MSERIFLQLGLVIGIMFMFASVMIYDINDIPYFCWDCYNDEDKYWSHVLEGINATWWLMILFSAIWIPIFLRSKT
jgi:hypothetical protein